MQLRCGGTSEAVTSYVLRGHSQIWPGTVADVACSASLRVPAILALPVFTCTLSTTVAVPQLGLKSREWEGSQPGVVQKGWIDWSWSVWNSHCLRAEVSPCLWKAAPSFPSNAGFSQNPLSS